MEDGMNVLLIATMDTKRHEADFVESCLKEAGVKTLIMDAGIMGTCDRKVHVSRDEVADAAGTSLEQVKNIGHEGKALARMIKGAVICARRLVEEGAVRGIMGVGGSMGTTLGTGVMRAFPVGFPKLMVSTMASRDTRSFVGTRDILMLHSVCDLAGLNRITRSVLRNGAAAMAGMVRWSKDWQWTKKPLVVLSTLGTTEACTIRLRSALEARGYETVVFHTVGSGGEAMDEFIREHGADAVIDLSLHEIADHRFGGDYDAGPNRGKAAVEKGIPTLLIPGNTDFLVTGPLAMAEKTFPGRKAHSHNAAITAIRATEKELKEIGRLLGRLCNAAQGPVAILIPEGGFSAFDHPDGPLYDPKGPRLFDNGLRETLKDHKAAWKVASHINDGAFADKVLEAFDRLVRHTG